MKKLLQRILPSAVVAGAVFLGQGANAALNDEIAERIKPVGEVCLEGDECAKAAAAPVVANDGPRSGEDVYNSACTACHSIGVANAPKKGDTAAWQARLDSVSGDVSALLSSITNGKGAMPAGGNCSDCSEDEYKAAIEFMSGLDIE
ncbi:c-type cytochrome [Zooshikella harenae]|uniref:Cytochrome c5 family protein n=1 Tax=Zooshikella harenae TaxID=2827238 RepID=A0ABS5ZHS6_9GAMM|nr:c-type cytochrome [Zooshikella harenae]MBU2713534.1 cytochrome c5 family protein [Zooshikella harenae]